MLFWHRGCCRLSLLLVCLLGNSRDGPAWRATLAHCPWKGRFAASGQTANACTTSGRNWSIGSLLMRLGWRFAAVTIPSRPERDGDPPYLLTATKSEGDGGGETRFCRMHRRRLLEMTAGPHFSPSPSPLSPVPAHLPSLPSFLCPLPQLSYPFCRISFPLPLPLLFLSAPLKCS